MAGWSELDNQVLRGEPRKTVSRLGRLGAGYSALDDQVLNARPRARVRNLGDFQFPPGPDINVFKQGFDWGGLIRIGASTASDILKARLAVPPPGTTIDARQGYIYRAQSGVPTAQLLPPGLLNGSGGIPTWLLLAGVAVVAIAVLKR